MKNFLYSYIALLYVLSEQSGDDCGEHQRHRGSHNRRRAAGRTYIVLLRNKTKKILLE